MHATNTFQKMAFATHMHRGSRVTTMGKSRITDVAAQNLREYENGPYAELTNTIRSLERRIVDLKTRLARAKAQDQAREDGKLLADDDDVSDELAELTNKFSRSHGLKNATMMAMRRILEKRADTDSHAEPASFTREVQAIQKRDGCTRTAAMTKARQERPALFQLYQLGADLKR